ncbi:hypothetical protein GO013_16100 [Pseudodesulfovibrio sp. JC047]|uniref:hypothetical protein n=1 Tax=Pseudodesulfovibrio sp. JC047 TaxID=2683199 RepID=UPI0013D510E8|nr:hypothetical protein [Pseudodesulfovibrio sp. JC047]NDV20934.1 hypothetical protein [Pseudodesulfovibrio sp. JC047]
MSVETSVVSFPVWQLTSMAITVLLAFFGFVFTIWKTVTALRDRDAKDAKKSAAEAVAKANENEKSILGLRAELPIEYVRREDWIRNQTIIEAKLDGLADKLDNQGGCRG